MLFIVIGLSLSMLPATAAEYDCWECTITRLGMEPNNAFGSTDGFMLTVDDASDNGWVGKRVFYLHDDLGKAGWATVLTAYSMGKTVWLRVADTAAGSLVEIIYIND